MITWEQNHSLVHFGILGQKWGVRRFQNEDGTLTEEGRKRYLVGVDEDGDKVASREAINIYNKVADEANKKLPKINKEWDKKRPEGFAGESLDDLKANLEYTKQCRDMWQETYRDVLAKDMGADPASIKGQKWLNDVFGYYSNFDDEIADLEKKVQKKEKSDSRFKDADDGKSSEVSIADYSKPMKKKINENYSPKEMKETVKNIVDYFKEQGIDILKSAQNTTTGKTLGDVPVDEQFYFLMKLFDADAFNDL